MAIDFLGLGSMGVGLIGSILGGSSAREQQMKMIAQMQRINQANLNRQIDLASPYIQAGMQAMNMTKNFTNQMNAERFATNPYYNQARNVSLAEANRQVARNVNSTNYAFGNNQGRARGEAQRIGRQGIQTQNSINMNWAQQTEADRMQKTQLYLNGVSMLNQAGYTGTNLMSNAYNNYAQQAQAIVGQTPINTTLQDVGGMAMGFGMNHLMNSQWMNAMSKGSGVSETVGNSGGNNSNVSVLGDGGINTGTTIKMPYQSMPDASIDWTPSAPMPYSSAIAPQINRQQSVYGNPIDFNSGTYIPNVTPFGGSAGTILGSPWGTNSYVGINAMPHALYRSGF